MAEKRNSWMVQKESEDLAKKSLATLAYEDSLENSPFPVPVPMMPGYRSLVGPSLATSPGCCFWSYQEESCQLGD
jgi:hypothetical protein